LIDLAEDAMSGVSNIKVGDTMPEFSAETHDGQEFALSSLQGKNELVLFFYPKANTGG